MSKKTILDTDYVTLWYYPETRIVHHKFHKYIYGEELRQVLEKGLAIFQQYGAEKWLSDDRENSALTTEDAAWAQEDWFPRVFESGWKYWALVMPDKVVGKVNMQRYIDNFAQQGLTIDVFDDPDEALQWLESV